MQEFSQKKSQQTYNSHTYKYFSVAVLIIQSNLLPLHKI